jgi:demethylmenaquinone methyltransferase/2-methoxy-6-polyprenyl-1,4-benzoquinol methylase
LREQGRLRYGHQMSNSDKKTEHNKTHFGFTEVDVSEKTERVRNVFDSVSNKYDLMNDVMSFGLHRLWKTALINQLKPKENMTILDVAGGTGDIAGRILRETNNKASVTICDININMMEVYRDKSIDRGIINKDQSASLICSNAEELPFSSASFDAYVIAFGLRNITHIEKALLEAHRVIKPGGRFICLEFSQVISPLLNRLYDDYSFRVLPKLGSLIARDHASYKYLVESIRKFPNQEELSFMLKEAGLGSINYQNLSGGIVAIHSAWRF